MSPKRLERICQWSHRFAVEKILLAKLCKWTEKLTSSPGSLGKDYDDDDDDDDKYDNDNDDDDDVNDDDAKAAILLIMKT